MGHRRRQTTPVGGATVLNVAVRQDGPEGRAVLTGDFLQMAITGRVVQQERADVVQVVLDGGEIQGVTTPAHLHDTMTRGRQHRTRLRAIVSGHRGWRIGVSAWPVEGSTVAADFLFQVRASCDEEGVPRCDESLFRRPVGGRAIALAEDGPSWSHHGVAGIGGFVVGEFVAGLGGDREGQRNNGCGNDEEGSCDLHANTSFLIQGQGGRCAPRDGWELASGRNGCGSARRLRAGSIPEPARFCARPADAFDAVLRYQVLLLGFPTVRVYYDTGPTGYIRPGTYAGYRTFPVPNFVYE